MAAKVPQLCHAAPVSAPSLGGGCPAPGGQSARTHRSAGAGPCLTGVRQAAGLAPQQLLPGAEPIAGKRRFVKCRHETSKSPFAPARS